MKRSRAVTDLQDLYSFKKAKNSAVRGSNVVILEPTSKTDLLYEFEISSQLVVGFGLYSGFIVEGKFEKKGAAQTATWGATEEADNEDMVIQQNWFEHLVKDVDVFHINSEISPHDSPSQADPFLNSFLLAHMHKSTKRHLCPEPCNPGNACSVTFGSWKNADDSDYINYSKLVLGKNLKFRYIPLFKFPFYQSANFVHDDELPRPIPIPAIGNLHIRFYLREGTSHIFKKTDACTSSFRFNLKSINLAVEELILNPLIERSMLTSKKRINYAGVTKLGMAHNIATGIFSYTAKLNKIYLPQGLFIFCLPKTVIPGTYTYQDYADYVFLRHNIKSVGVYFGGKSFYTKTPTPFDWNYLTADNKQYFDHLNSPPFGVRMDSSLVQYSNLEGGGSASPYPHIYIDLTQGSPGSRLITENDDGSIVQNREFLDVALQFKHPGTVNATYYVYYFYTDYNVILDMNLKRFTNVYNNTKLTI